MTSALLRGDLQPRSACKELEVAVARDEADLMIEAALLDQRVA